MGAHFDLNPQEYGHGATAKASVDEVHKVLELMDVDDMYAVYKGAEYPLKNEETPQMSEGAAFIIEEAMREDDHPLFIACQGSLTDLASAILIKPEICSKMTAIWIGGGQYPNGGMEFNCRQDVAAANVLMKSKMDVWQIPITVYKQMAVTLSELQLNVEPCGEIGKYLFDQMVSFNDKCADYIQWPHGEIWGLGDSPTIGVLLEEAEKTDIYDMKPAPIISYDDLTYSYEIANREIRVYNQVNARLVLGDFFAKMKINYGN